jgi:hypothetical protein
VPLAVKLGLDTGTGAEARACLSSVRRMPIDASMEAILLLILLGTTIWVAVDANQKDWRNHSFANATWKWVLGMLLLWIVAFPVYLAQRGKVPAKS